jgi:integrase
MAAKPYTGKIHVGGGKYVWVGRFASRQERDEAVMRRRIELEAEAARTKLPPGERVTCREYADEYLSRMEAGALLTKSGRQFKASSISTARGQLNRFKQDFGDSPLSSIGRHEAVRWAEKHDRKQGVLQSVVTLFALAVDEELIDRNPFRGMMRKPAGRADQPPPTDDELSQLLDACNVHGDYGYRIRAMLTFCAFSGVRPGEAMALDWADVNLPALRVHICKRLYRGEVDLPKSNQARMIALTPPARDALLTLPERQGPVFRSKSGGRLCAPLLSSYWRDVQIKAGLRFDWYLATKHTCVHYMKVKLGLPNHVIAEQMGWSERSVEKMIATYGHTSVGALEAIDAAFASVATESQQTASPLYDRA